MTLESTGFPLMAYFLPLEAGSWNLYFGGGPALKIMDFNRRTGRRDLDEEPDLNLLGGLSHGTGFFTEVKFGLFERPAVKFGVGYAWR